MVSGQLLNIAMITLSGSGVAVVVFVLCLVICQKLGVEKIQNILSLSAFKNNQASLFIIFVISITLINFLFYKFGYSIKFFAACIFLYAMLLLAAIDLKTQILPDIITKPLIAIGILQGYLGIFTDLQSSILGAIAGYFVLWSVNYIFRIIRGIDGMGYGDFKLLSAISAWAGVKTLPLTILISSVVGVFVALLIIKLTKSSMKAPTPFGPSLVLTGFIAILYGNDIMGWYLGLMSVE